jgi:hypothetical protein
MRYRIEWIILRQSGNGWRLPHPDGALHPGPYRIESDAVKELDTYAERESQVNVGLTETQRADEYHRIRSSHHLTEIRVPITESDE